MKFMKVVFVLLAALVASGCATTVGEYYSDTAFAEGRARAETRERKAKLVTAHINQHIKAVEQPQPSGNAATASDALVRQDTPPTVLFINRSNYLGVRVTVNDGLGEVSDGWQFYLKPGEHTVYPDNDREAAEFWQGQDYIIQWSWEHSNTKEYSTFPVRFKPYRSKELGVWYHGGFEFYR